MVMCGSLQIFPGLGSCKLYGVSGNSDQLKVFPIGHLGFYMYGTPIIWNGIHALPRHAVQKCTFGNGQQLQLSKVPLSSHALRQDPWSLHMSNIIKRPMCHIPFRYNGFVCRSFSASGWVNETPIYKSAALALKRSYSTLHATPTTFQLVSAIGIVAFAVWGLLPLVRYSRNVFLRRIDSNWKKSRSYYIASSYLQPLLLWTGAILICRVLDPVILPSEASEAVKQRVLTFVRSLSTVLAFAYCLSSVIQQLQKFFMETYDSTDARNMGFQFVSRAVYTAVWVAAFALFMELLGFRTQKWLTAGGLGTVLLTLAGREIFTNFLSSVMIHATRPFILNEWIQTKVEGYEVSGTVEHVGWWSPTIIRGENREAIHIPNHKFTMNVVRNLSQKTHWRIKTHLAISHLDANKINSIVADMRKVLAKNPQVEQQRLHRRVFLDNIDPENQALLILVSCFVKTSHFEEYLCVKEAILLDLLRVISHHRARLATPIRTVQKIYGDADMENVPFAESIVSHAASPSNRPLLLIGPQPRINSDDKTKARPNRVVDEQVTRSTTVVDSKTIPPSSENSSQNGSDKQAKKSSGDARSKSGKGGTTAAPTRDSAQPQKPYLEGPDSNTLKSKDGKSAETASDKSPVPTLESAGEKAVTPPPVTRPAIEENIVLGVALEGSKRTLPIDEGIDPSPSPKEGKETLARRNGNVPLSAGKDRKDKQIPSVPGSAGSDQRDQEK